MFEAPLIEKIEGRIAAPGRADERSFLRPCLDVGAGLSREAGEGYVDEPSNKMIGIIESPLVHLGAAQRDREG